MTRRLALAGAALLVLAVVYLVAWGTQPGTTRATGLPAPQAVAVTAVTRSCPPPAPGNGGKARIAVISLPARAPAAGPGAAQDGAATLSAVPAAPGSATKGKPAAAAARPVTVSGPGTLTTVTAPGDTGSSGTAGTAVAVSGRMAEGFEAEQANAAGTGLVSCTHPASDMWFAGAGATDGASSITLYLMNTGDLPASANVTILTDAGTQAGLGSAITIAPHRVVTQPIEQFVAGSSAVALHVQTSSGQVAASVWEDGGSGGAWLPQAAAPATSLVIPGLTAASSSARLFVTVPGTSDAQLKVVAFTAQGQFTQFGATPVDAPAGATSSLSLSSLGASAAGLELTSNVPVVAAVQVPGQGIGSFTAAVPPVTGQGIVAGNPATRGLTVGLVLTAPAGAARASITVVGSGGSGGSGGRGARGAPGTGPAGAPQVVTVQGRHTVAVAVSRPSGSRQPFAIAITPAAGSGPLYAARVVTSGSGGLSGTVTALLPVPSAPTAVTLPPVQNAYTAVLP